MKKIMYDMLSRSENVSSSRVINVGGWLVGTVVVVYHTFWLGGLTYDLFAVYMGYCAGTYGLNRFSERRGEYDGRSKEYNIDNPDSVSSTDRY